MINICVWEEITSHTLLADIWIAHYIIHAVDPQNILIFLQTTKLVLDITVGGVTFVQREYKS